MAESEFFLFLKKFKKFSIFFCFTTSSFLAVKKSSCSLLKTMFQNFFLHPPPFSDVFIIKLFPSTWFFHHAAHDLTMNKKKEVLFFNILWTLTDWQMKMKSIEGWLSASYASWEISLWALILLSVDLDFEAMIMTLLPMWWAKWNG